MTGVGVYPCPSGDPDRDLIGGQHLQGRGLAGLGQGVGIHPQKQRTLDAVGLAIVADGLGDGQNVIAR